MPQDHSEASTVVPQDREHSRRSSLVRSIAEMFVLAPAHAPADLSSFTDLALGLYPSAPETDRQFAARLLALRADLPALVAEMIATDEIGIAAPFLAESPALDEAALIRIAGRASLDHARAIAKRDGLGPRIVRALAALGVAATRRSEPEASAPVMPPIAARAEPLPIAVSTDQATTAHPPRGDLSRFLALDMEHRLTAIEAVEDEIRLDPSSHGRLPAPAVALEVAGRLFAAAAAHDDTQLAGLLARELHLDDAAAGRLVADVSGEAKAVALVALGLASKTATGIIILRHGGAMPLWHIRSLVALSTRLERRVAERLLSRWRGHEHPVAAARQSEQSAREKVLDDALARVARQIEHTQATLVRRA